MKKTYMIPATIMVRLKMEHLLANASETTTPIHDDETVDNPDDLLSRDNDPHGVWTDDEDLEENDDGKVRF